MFIKKLSSDTIKILQAQRYVFDYTKIIKELVENSLDAKSTRIIINISKTIEVWDNGIGMESDIDYFTTNKETEKVLDGINTEFYGYKGIFLSSLQDISDLEIITKRSDEKLANHICYKDGTRKKVPRENGTTIIVSNLFNNSPVRKRNLKLKVPEITRLLECFLIFQNVFIRLTVNQKTVLEKQGCTLDQFVAKNAFHKISGKSFDFFYKLNGLKSSIILMDKRIVINKKLMTKIKSMLDLFFRSNVFYVLQLKNVRFDILSIDKQIVLLEESTINDVISTLELEFSDSRLFMHDKKISGRSNQNIHEKQSSLTVKRLKLSNDAEKNSKIQIWGESVVNSFGQHNLDTTLDSNTSYIDTLLSEMGSNENKENMQDEMPSIHSVFKRMVPNIKNNIEIPKNDLRNVKIIGQFHRGFILGILNGYVIIFDQHAVDEIYNYETIKKGIKFNKQSHLKPIQIDEDIVLDISSNDAVITSKIDREMIEKASKSYIVKDNKLYASPTFKNHILSKNDYMELISTGEISSLNSKIASKACRMSIMIGDLLNHQTMTRIVSNLAGLDNPWNCPHGRPTFQVLYKL